MTPTTANGSLFAVAFYLGSTHPVLGERELHPQIGTITERSSDYQLR